MRSITERLFQIALLGFVFLLPWQTRWIWHDAVLNGSVFEYGRFSLYLTDAFLVAAVVFGLLARRRRDRHPIFHSHEGALLVLLVIASLSMFVASDKQLAGYVFLRFVIAVGLFAVIVRQRFLSLEAIAFAFVAGAVVQAGLAIGQFFTQDAFASTLLGTASHDAAQAGTAVVETSAGRFLRSYGSLPHPNVLAGLLAVALFFLFGFYLKLYATAWAWFKRHPHTKRRMIEEQERHEIASMVVKLTAILTAAVVASFGLAFTFSRSAWVGLGAGFLLAGLTFLFRREWYRLWLLGKFTLVIVVTAFIAFAFAPGSLSTRLLAAERIEQRSTTERVAGLDDATQLLRNSWHTGIGIGSYTLAVHDTLDRHRPGYAYQPVHNLYLLVAVELSVFGLLALLFFLVETLHHFLVTLPARNRASPFWVVSFGSAAFCLLVIGVLDHYLWTLPTGLAIFWLTMGMFWHSMHVSSDRRHPQ